MEEKKSHKADLEHKRPWMFAAGFLISIIAFTVAMEWHIGGSDDDDDWEDDLAMDLNIKPDDQRDMISAAEKTQPKEQKETENINKVEESTELPPEILDKIKFQPQEEEDDDLKPEEDKEDPINQNEDDPDIERIVEELPQYPGGMVEYMKWLTANLKYPKVALARQIQGKVMVSFIVNTDGTITNMKLAQKSNTYLDNEALRVLRMMPKWTPAKNKGKACRAMVAVPVVFAL